jgi:uncharacterized OB-fold protein
MSTGHEKVRFSAPHQVEYAYRRSVGPVLGRFFTELRDRRIVGSRTASGRVYVPPAEYDPETGASVDEIVDVGPGGVVTSWSWIAEPHPKHPFSRPFAFALIQLDGADTSLLHAVDVSSEDAIRSGLRVRPRWRKQTCGEILDIECFEPEESAT